MRFRDFQGRYVMHCHNVVHEDHAMMVNFTIGQADPVNAGGGMAATWQQNSAKNQKMT
jgi:hypothetical protein